MGLGLLENDGNNALWVSWTDSRKWHILYHAQIPYDHKDLPTYSSNTSSGRTDCRPVLSAIEDPCLPRRSGHKYGISPGTDGQTKRVNAILEQYIATINRTTGTTSWQSPSFRTTLNPKRSKPLRSLRTTDITRASLRTSAYRVTKYVKTGISHTRRSTTGNVLLGGSVLLALVRLSGCSVSSLAQAILPWDSIWNVSTA